MEKAKWIWHFGDFEIYHSLMLHSRRQEFEVNFPPFWAQDMPHQGVVFLRNFTCEKPGYIKVHTNGIASVFVDRKAYNVDVIIPIEPGDHKIFIRAMKVGGLPCIYVDSDVCPSCEKWTATHMTDYEGAVGCVPEYFNISDNPEIFPFKEKALNHALAEEKEGGVLYDFGRETFARLVIEGSKGEELYCYYGESKEEAEGGTHALIREKISGKKSYELVPRAFRYVFIKGGDINSLKVSAIYEYLPLKDRGSFKSCDKMLNKIWEVSAYTIHLNSREFYLDGIKRDRWIWSGDAYQSYMINNYLYFDKDITRRTILGLRGQDYVEQHINTITDYSLYWIISIYDYYFSYNDKDFLKNIFPKMKSLYNFCQTRLNSDGFITKMGGDWIFIDWGEIDKDGAVCAEQILLWKATKTMAQVAHLINEPAELYEEKEKILYKNINKFYWNKQKGAFIDCYESGKENVTRQANILAVLYDFTTDEQTESIIKNVIKNNKVTSIKTPYFKFFEMLVLCKIGEISEVINIVRDYWGGMIKLGATTIWEEFNPEKSGVEHYKFGPGLYFKSLCHAWGAGPIYLFGRYLLGVYPTTPGYKTFNVEPNLGGLSGFEGTVPVNDKDVFVSIKNGILKVKTNAEGGTLIWQGKTYELDANKEMVLM